MSSIEMALKIISSELKDVHFIHKRPGKEEEKALGR